jgi:thioredoxin-related protein
MKVLFSLLLLATFLAPAEDGWMVDFNKAKAEAAQSNKMILLNFSGSDWCIPCIRLHKEIFESEAFKRYAKDHLVLVNADFPRLKKHQLSKEQTKQNEALAARYDPKGSFPLTVLLNSKGEVIRQWEGYPNENPDQFVGEIERLGTKP